jgi:hypothetical protein
MTELYISIKQILSEFISLVSILIFDKKSVVLSRIEGYFFCSSHDKKKGAADMRICELL